MQESHLKSLAVLWLKAQPVVEVYLGSLFHDRNIAEDILQQVALTVTEKFAEYDPEKPFTGWALGIARNHALKQFERSRTDRHRFDNDLIGQLTHTHERLSEEIEVRQEALNHCMEKLPRRSRTLLGRRYVQGLKPGKIADELGVSPNSIRISLHRIRVALRNCIELRIGRPKA